MTIGTRCRRKMASRAKDKRSTGSNTIIPRTQSVNGIDTRISSGVASWEPAVGGEENPFHMPIEYTSQVSLMAPASMQYTEEPLGEAFYPGAFHGL